MGIINPIKFKAIRLVKIMKWFGVFQFIFLNFLSIKDNAPLEEDKRFFYIRSGVISMNYMYKHKRRSAIESIKTKQAHSYLWRSCTKKVEAMVISFWTVNLTDTRPLKQVGSYSCARYPSTLIKLNLNKLAKATSIWFHEQKNGRHY